MNEKAVKTLGRTTNLLYGYNAAWLSESCGNDALYPVRKKAMKEIEASLPHKTSKWGFPTVSLHDTATSLLNTLLPYRIHNPSDGIEEPELSSGAMLINDNNSSEAIRKLSALLGVNLANKESRYALVQIARSDGEAIHPSNQMGVLIHPNPSSIPKEFGVSRDLPNAMADLKRVKLRGAAFSVEAIGVQEANDYLDFFAQMGTHFVSKILFGDVIFQVFAMPEDRYKRVKKLYAGQQNMLSGPNSILFRQYTTDHNTGAYGYVSEYGKLLSFSGSLTLRKGLEEHDWLEQTFSLQQSIFALYQDNAKIDTDRLNSTYTDVTAIMTELTSLTLFAEYSRKQSWRRIFTGAMIQKYRNAIKPVFTQYDTSDLSAALNQNELPGFLSVIATPVINTYKTSFDLADLSFVAPEEVKEFTLYGNYLYNSKQTNLLIPGDDVMICGQLFSLETQDYTTTIQVTDKALDTLSISSRSFYGALQVCNASDTAHWTVVDGLKYISNDNGPDGRAYVSVTDDVRKAPQPRAINRLKNSLQFNYAFAEAGIATISAVSDNDKLKNFIKNSLLWLTEIIPAATTDKDLLELRLRALDRSLIDSDNSLGAFVPLLPYEEYKEQINIILDYIDTIDSTIDRYHTDIELRKTQELVIKVATDLNSNIINSGKLLAGYVQASITQQQELSAYYDSIIIQKQKEQKAGEAQISKLQGELQGQQSSLTTAVENYKQAIKDWKITEEIKFALTVATDLFSLATTIAVPASSINAVKDLGIIVQRIQKFLNIINSTFKVFSDTQSGIGKLSDAQKTFDGLSDTLSANLNWDELSIKFDEVLATGPSDSMVNDKKAALVAAFKIYVLKGKALASAQSNVQQSARDVYSQQRQKHLIEDQASRLAELNTTLAPAKIEDLDVSKIDLIGLTGTLSLIRSQMLGILARAFITQDQVLQYTWLQPATPISSFDILGIKGALVAQYNTSIIAKTSMLQCQPTTTTPIDVVIEVPADALKNGGIYQLNLQPTAAAFYQYVNVRIKSVVAVVEGIKKTDSGKYLLDLSYSGTPFSDRSVNRDMAIFNTVRRTRTYEYDVDGNRPRFSDSGESWSEDVNPVTPFSLWEISLPNTKTNKGIVFDGLTVTITLSFVLHARIHEERNLTLTRKRMMLRAAAPVKPPKNTLLAQMFGKSVLNNWDVVFNMSLDQINRVLKTQYDTLKNIDKKYGGKISADTAVPAADIGEIKQFSLLKFDIEYGYPKLEFLVNNDNTGNLEMQILPGGTVQKGSRYVGDNTEDNNDFLLLLAKKSKLVPIPEVKLQTIGGIEKLVLEYYNQSTPLGANASLQAVIQISQVKGLVGDSSVRDQILSVVLEMEKGAFSANNIEIEMSDIQAIAFSDAVKSYFTLHPVTFIINSLNMTGIATLADLKPHQFYFKALQTQSGNKLLQLFIQTSDRNVLPYSQTFMNSDVTDPIPEGSECSLIINSRIFFGSVLPSCITSGWSLKGSDPGNASTAWNGSFTTANVHASVDMSRLNHSSPGTATDTSSTSYYITYEPAGGNPVTWSLAGMTISPQQSGVMKLSFDAVKSFSFLEITETTIWRMFGGNKSYKSSITLSTDITLQIISSMQTKVSGEMRNQQIQVTVDSKVISVPVRTSGGGPCGSDDLQAKVNAELQKALPPQIQSNLDFGFTGVSVFALENLLFPSGNCIKLEDVSVPGDLLILGNFV
jgi:hypothetical protein